MSMGIERANIYQAIQTLPDSFLPDFVKPDKGWNQTGGFFTNRCFRKSRTNIVGWLYQW